MSKASRHVKRGLVVHSSEQAARRIVELVKKNLGDKYPAFFSTDIGKAVEAPLLCTLVHEAAGRFDLPGSKQVQKLSGFALEGCSGDLAEIAKKYLGPLVGDLGGMALLMVGDGFDDDDDYDE